MPVEAVDRIGSVIDGRYKVVEVMASGSMGAVYKAERVPVGKLVAIKFLHASFANDSEFQARFERETRVMSKLNHPNCVSVLDFGVWENAPYLVMDFVAGTTLRSRIDKHGALPAAKALAIARQIVAGLAHAHQQEVWHRDVKPANIMISEEIGHGERVRILDFGLARLQGNVGRDATQTNMVVGTPNYMAPEQTVPGAMIDGRTDLYAVGVVIFEMIVGDRPFHAEDTLQLLGMHRAAPIPRLADRVKEGVEVPPGVQELVDKAMAKSPDKRFQNAIEFAAAIDEVMAGKVDPTDIDVTLPKMKTGPVAIVASRTAVGLADTVLGVDASELEREMRPRRKASWFGALLLVGGAAAMAGYLIKRNADTTRANSKVIESSAADASAAHDPRALGGADAGFAVAMAPAPDAGGEAIAPAVPDASAEAAHLADAGVVEYLIIDSGPLPDPPEEIEVDPSNAEDPDETKGSAAPPDDEADNAPKTEAEVEKHETPPPAPQLARTVREAVLMIKAGKRDLALSSLRVLWKKNHNSAYIPFLLGNLYFDRTWWSVALDHYRAAIKKNAGYKNNAVLNRNVIRMLASTKTRQAATNFLRGVIGRPSRQYLLWAAQHEPNPVVRSQAKTLARYIR